MQDFHGSPVDGQDWQISLMVCGTIDANIASQLCVAPDIVDVDAILMDHARRFWTSLCSSCCTDGRGGGREEGQEGGWQEDETETSWRRASNHNSQPSQDNGKIAAEAFQRSGHVEGMLHAHLFD